MDSEPTHWITALRRSHERLRALVGPLDGERLRSPSYASEWSIADVLSHVGSTAEIFALFLDAGLTGGQPPGREQFEPIWAVWNAKSAEEQAADAVAVDAAFVARIETLDPAQRDQLHLSMFGMEVDIVGLARMRLSEHAVHTWDIAVALDDAAVIDPDAVTLLVDTLAQLVARIGHPTGDVRAIAVRTTGPDREYVLGVGETVTLIAGGGDPGLPEIRIPAEAFVRLVYGRLDPGHSPTVGGTGAVDLDLLRSVFPGF
jgi:uncharacterized protein (TIGR03083 family)